MSEAAKLLFIEKESQIVELKKKNEELCLAAQEFIETKVRLDERD